MNRLNLFLAAALTALTVAAHADTVVNLNATTTQDGNVFYKTFSSSNLAVGNYTATFVGAGYKASDGTTAAYTAYSKYTPAATNWSEGVSIDTTGATFSSTYAANTGLQNTTTATNSALFGTSTRYATASDALAAAAGLTYNFTIGTTGSITFYIQDQNYPTFPGYGDNSGGASLDVKAVTPEPSSLILLGTGAMGLVGAVRRRFNA